MENRFLQVCDELDRAAGKKPRYANGGAAGAMSTPATRYSRPFAATDRALVVLIENGGVDLGIPDLVDKLLSKVPGSSVIPASARAKLVDAIRDKLKSVTDNLIETAELSLNRYTAARPAHYGDVAVLRDGTSSYDDLKRTLIAQSRAGKVMDVVILTHGSGDFISVPGGVNGRKIRDIRAEFGKPLTIRCVYMMNCVGSSLNQAWIDAGAKVSSGAAENNYLPEPSTFFFWSAWKDGQAFETAVTSAYRKTVNLMNDLVRGFVTALPFPGSGFLASKIDFATMDFVTASRPVVQGQGSVTVNSDALSFAATASGSLVTTVLPLSLVRALGSQMAAPPTARVVSPRGLDLIKRWEKDSVRLAQRVAEVQQALADLVTVPLTQNQYDALASFVYGVGDDAFKASTLRALLNRGEADAVPGEMRKWTKVRNGPDGPAEESPELGGRRAAEAALFAAPDAATAQSVLDQTPFSRPLYDTGEHALFGQFINGVVTGPIKGVYALQPTTTFAINTVRFTYGQIITMGDFYGDYTKLTHADPAELTRVKGLIARSENHYKNTILGLGKPAADVTNKEWGDPTVGIGDRFLDLAIRNNSHFAPPATTTPSHLITNNRDMWQRYHAEAIAKARAGKSSAALDAAYPINAFGDHFLTDAFSAGHLINKELVMNKFIANVMSGGKVNSAGEALFEKVADGVLARPRLKKELGEWELAKREADKGFKKWNLDQTGWPTDGVFKKVLIRVMEDTKSGGQEQIANLAAKAVHDYLNTYPDPRRPQGVPVKNAKGTSWDLTGDGTLNEKNIKIIQLAVKQSVENIEDAVRNPSTPLATYYQRVWDHVPLLTHPPTRSIVDSAIAMFTDPSRKELVAKAIDLVDEYLDTLLSRLKKAGEIQEDKPAPMTPDEIRRLSRKRPEEI